MASEEKINKKISKKAIDKDAEKEAAPKEPKSSDKAEDAANNELQAQLEKAKADLSETHERYLRLAAEYDNFRKRSQKEKEAIYPEAFASAVSAFLPVLDNLERASNEKSSDENYKKGIDLIYKQLLSILEKLGVSEIEADGKPFNPDLHNAVMHVAEEDVEENTIVEVFQKGFKLGDRVLRHSVVKVAN